MKAMILQQTSSIFLVLQVVLTALTSGLTAQEISVDDLMPPVSGGTREIQRAEQVAVRDNVVSAATAQDAVNASVDYLQHGEAQNVRASFILFGSGMGAVATGEASYVVVKDPIATQVSQREAYIVAYNRAKKNLAGLFNGYEHKADTNVKSALARIAASEGRAANTSRDNSYGVKQTVSALLKGFVVYDVAENPETRSVSVTIATTPKTLGKVTRTSTNRLAADDLRYGLEQILNEVKLDLVPPIGGRVLTVENTGETAVIGFGSCVIPSHDDATVQSDLRRQALTTAAEYASDVLCGLLLGDEVVWNGGSNAASAQHSRSFEELVDVDPLTPVAWDEVKQLEEQRIQFTRQFRRTDEWRSVRRGTLPAGVVSRTWQDGDWAYAMAVYVPSLTDLAAGLATQMKESSLLKPVNVGTFGSPGDADEPKKLPSFRPRPSGRVSADQL